MAAKKTADHAAAAGAIEKAESAAKPKQPGKRRPVPREGPAASMVALSALVPVPAPAGVRPATAAGLKAAVNGLGSGAYDAFQEIEGLFRHEEQGRLAFWWNVGTKFVAVQDRYKEAGLAAFCLYLDKDPREVRIAVRAARYWDEDEITGMVARGRKHNGSVTWSNIREILQLDDEAERSKYIAVIEKQQIGREQLAAMIRADRTPGTPVGKGGRRFNIPATFDGICRSGHTHVAALERFFTQLGEKLPGIIQGIPEEEYSPQLLDRVRELRSQYTVAVRAAEARELELVAFERRLERRVEQAPAPAVAAEEPAPDATPAHFPAPRRRPALAGSGT